MLIFTARFVMGKHLRNDHDHEDRCDNDDDHCDYEEVDGGDVDLHCKVQVGPAPDHEIENSDHHDDLEVDNIDDHDEVIIMRTIVIMIMTIIIMSTRY